MKRHYIKALLHKEVKKCYPHKMHKIENTKNDQKHQNEKHKKGEKCNHKTSKMMKNRGGSFSALKPGPVVPPGTQKTPDQAARKSQSAVFGHLSDILAFFRGG